MAAIEAEPFASDASVNVPLLVNVDDADNVITRFDEAVIKPLALITELPPSVRLPGPAIVAEHEALPVMPLETVKVLPEFTVKIGELFAPNWIEVTETLLLIVG